MQTAQIISLLLQGLPNIVELVFELQAIQASGKTEITLAEYQQLKSKYGVKTADQYLAEAGGAPVNG